MAAKVTKGDSIGFKSVVSGVRPQPLIPINEIKRIAGPKMELDKLIFD